MRVVGIEIENRAFRLVVLDGTAKRWKVSGLACETLPPPTEGEDPQAALAAAVENAFRRLKAPRDPVVAVFPASDCVFRHLLLPFKGDEQIRKVLKFESEGHLHHWNIDDIVVDYLPLGEVKGQTSALIAAAAKDTLKKALQTCEASGFDPQTLDLDATALFNAALQTGSLPGEGTCLLLHVGARSSLVLLVEDRMLRQIRAVRAGLETLFAAVSRDPGLDPGAEKGAAEPGPGDDVVIDFGPDAGDDSERGSEAAERGSVPTRREDLAMRLAREVARSTAGAPLARPLGSVLLSGPGAVQPHLQAGLQREIGLPVSVLNPLEGAEGSIPENEVRTAGPLVSVALGAALKGIGLDACGIDMRQEEIRFTRTFERVKVPLLAALALLLVALLLENIYLFRKTHDNLRPSLETVYARARDYAKNLAKVDTKRAEAADLLKRVAILKTDVEKELKDLREKLGQGVDYPMSSLEAWRLVFDRIAETKDKLGRFSLDELRFDTVGKPAKGGGLEYHVNAALTAIFYGPSEEANPRYDDLRAALEGAPWVRAFQGAGVRRASDVEASVAENIRFEVVVPAPKAERSP